MPMELQNLVKPNELKVKEQLKRNRYLARTHVSMGSCKNCPLKDSCMFVDEDDSQCGLVSDATSAFYEIALKCSFIRPEDTLALKSLASMHGVIILCEQFFSHYGSMGCTDDGEAYFNQLMQSYLTLLPKYNKCLADFGMTPRGRKILTDKVDQDVTGNTLLADYVLKKANDVTVRDVESVQSEVKAKRNRFLQRQKPTESESS